MKFKLPSDVRSEEVVLLKPLVQPGVASRAFSHLGPGDLLQMVRSGRRVILLEVETLLFRAFSRIFKQFYCDFQGFSRVFQGFPIVFKEISGFF